MLSISNECENDLELTGSTDHFVHFAQEEDIPLTSRVSTGRPKSVSARETQAGSRKTLCSPASLFPISLGRGRGALRGDSEQSVVGDLPRQTKLVNGSLALGYVRGGGGGGGGGSKADSSNPMLLLKMLLLTHRCRFKCNYHYI